MVDFTKMSDEQFGIFLDKFEELSNMYFDAFKKLKEIYGNDRTTEKIIYDALAVTERKTTIEELQKSYEASAPRHVQ